ncbi:MAG: hypothetical protein EU536_01380 [Promethearchaeota archaeon]|nr:MAG: hypothetical protein EU536_01380 [Candidatus Lokiarchaeota archaeon]
MPRLERKLDIKASAETIFNILDDTMNYPRWNIVVNEITELAPNKHFARTNVGDITSTRTETVKNKKISVTQENSPMTAMGYILNPEGDLVHTTIWAEFELEDQEPILGMAGEIFLKSLKKFAEYLEAGGAPEAFQKK